MAQAFITEIQQKETSAGTMYDFIFSDGNKVGAGKFPPKGFSAGDYVNYDVTMRGQYMNLKAGSMSKAPAPAGVSAPAAPAVRSTGGHVTADKRQETISKQAALNSAMTFVNILVATDALPLPKTKDKRADAIEEIAFRYTAKFYNLATGETYELPDVGFGDNDLGADEAGDNWNEE